MSDVLDWTFTRRLACVLSSSNPREIRTFGTMTSDLLALSDWLTEQGCTHVAMESTGDYWKPVFNLAEDIFEVILVNPQHVKAVPGRKTDVKDAEWLAELLRHGLLRASFIPPVAQRELRDLTRYRSTFVRQRATLAHRVQKLLEDTNIKLSSVATGYPWGVRAVDAPVSDPWREGSRQTCPIGPCGCQNKKHLLVCSI
jgi:hypothetical protein